MLARWSFITFLVSFLVLKLIFTSAYEGDATYYGGAGNRGSCNQNYVPEGYKTVAMNNAQYKEGLACGNCLEGCIMKPDGKECFKAIVDNKCPECAFGDIDMGESGDGRWNISWNYITCPSIEPIFSTQGSNSWYGKLKIEGGGKISTVTINGMSANPTPDAFWVVKDGSGKLGCGPKVIVTLSTGKTIEKCVPGSLFGGSCSNGQKCSSSDSISESKISKIAENTCTNGIPHSDGKTCCPKSCGSCGGANCGTLPGGASNCCATRIQVQHNRSCDLNPAPCTMSSNAINYKVVDTS